MLLFHLVKQILGDVCEQEPTLNGLGYVQAAFANDMLAK